MPVNALRAFLDSNKVRYVTINHSPAYTAQEIAESANITGKELAKTVIIKIDGKMAMLVLPATQRISLDLVKEVLGVQTAELASENEFRGLFPQCELGAMPPFGNLYGMDVYISHALTEEDEIAFNAGSHTVLIKMNYKDYDNLVRPQTVDTFERVPA